MDVVRHVVSASVADRSRCGKENPTGGMNEGSQVPGTVGATGGGVEGEFRRRMRGALLKVDGGGGGGEGMAWERDMEGTAGLCEGVMACV